MYHMCNLMVHRRQNKEAVKGAILFAMLVFMVFTFFLLSGTLSADEHSDMLICRDAHGRLDCRMAQN